ncbi:MAG TPA: chorismate-binding protein [Salinimicrobium sp.]|nr:chorismate-binding protein [Salinimicrobium sp.]
MTSEDFFEKINEHFERKLPFVVYRKPNEKSVKCFLQNNDQLFTSEELSETGFIFAPFDNQKQNILIPENSSEKLIFKYEGGKLISEEKKIHSEENLSQEKAEKNKFQHISLVKKGISALNSGNMEKVVLSRKEEIPLKGKDPLELFQQLLENYENAFVYCWFHPKVGLWLGASPETLLKVEGKQFSTMSLAGTQKFQEKAKVEWGEKEKQEQKFVTDEIISSLKAFSSKISVSEVHTAKAGNLLHLKTDIKGEISAENLKDVVFAIHPTPAVCGLPKEEAKKFIFEEENYDREFYTGFLGELNLKNKISRSGNRRNVENQAYAAVRTESSLYVNLRCMKIEGENAILFIGGGITKDSIAEDEWQETVNKAETMKKVLRK